MEGQARVADIAVTAGLRFDRFAAGTERAGEARGAQRSLSPRFAVSTVLRGATFVASYGRFTQAPDYQFLVHAAFDDTTRTGRFRRGNPGLGFERATQYEFSVRVRPREGVALRVGVYRKRLTGLVASVPLGIDPDSTVFGNADAGTSRGLELPAERELRNGFGFESRTRCRGPMRRPPTPSCSTGSSWSIPRPATRSGPRARSFRWTTISGTRSPSSCEARRRRRSARASSACARSPGSKERCSSAQCPACPSRWRTTDSLLGVPNGSRLPGSSTIDLLVRRPIRLGRTAGGIYLDVRNLLDRRNVVAVRRDTGQPEADDAAILRLAESAYASHPETIPYESARYRQSADLDGDGYLSGREELFPLYVAAARDFTSRCSRTAPPGWFAWGSSCCFSL
ncbi:MAG: TonB-dependent receptor [Gemmatimonadales bacterium]|nr:TonB-dependent receptor [Gemmatimonadales bacterium]